MSGKRIVTARVLKAQRELIEALGASVETAIQQSGLTKSEAQGKLSAVISEVWNEAETRIESCFSSQQT